MIRITYTHYCDKCKAQLEHERIEHYHGVPPPMPMNASRAFGMDLCESCKEKVTFAVREAFA